MCVALHTDGSIDLRAPKPSPPPSLANPRQLPVAIVYLDRSRKLGRIEPGASVSFRHCDIAAVLPEQSQELPLPGVQMDVGLFQQKAVKVGSAVYLDDHRSGGGHMVESPRALKSASPNAGGAPSSVSTI